MTSISEREYLVRGALVVADAEDPSGSFADGAVHVSRDRVVAVDTFDVLHAANPTLSVIGSTSIVVLPGLVNAHDHGRGVSTSQVGLTDRAVELWMLTLGDMPAVDPYLAAAYSAATAIEAGITTVVNNWYEAPAARYRSSFFESLAGHEAAGIRSAWVLQILDRSGVEDIYHGCLPDAPPELATRIMSAVERRPRLLPSEYFAFCDHVARTLPKRSARASVLCGPVSVHWCSDGLLEQVAEFAEGSGLWMQTHLLESPYQARRAALAHGESMVSHLDRIGFLGAHLSCAHCVWLSESDIRLLADAGVSVVHCPGSNLRLASGIAPVAAMRSAGINVALGLDSNTLNDNGDPWQEMRLARHLHRQPGDTTSSVSAWSWLQMATKNGARAIGLEGEVGVLAPGAKADLVLVSTDRIVAPWATNGENLAPLVLARAEAGDVQSVIIDGKLVMHDRQLLTVDKSAISEQIRQQLEAAVSQREGPEASLAQELLPIAERLCCVPVERMGTPYYRVNSKERL